MKTIIIIALILVGLNIQAENLNADDIFLHTPLDHTIGLFLLAIVPIGAIIAIGYLLLKGILKKKIN